MKPFSLVFAFALAASTIPAQAQVDGTLPHKYWIFLQDKAGPAGKTAAVEAGYVTARALERRTRRGTSQPASLDAPVSRAYLEALAHLGVKPLIESRWLNAISARLSPEQRVQVGQLPFVRAVQPVGRALHRPAPSAEVEPPPTSGKASSRFRLDYGASERQLAVINAIEPLERGINGAGVVLGFLDTEYDGFTHPAFARLVAEGRLIAEGSFVDSLQTNRHGRQVASVAVGYAEGQLIGPAYGAHVLAAVTEYAPTETNQEEDNFVAGLEWLEAQGADVVNASLGYTTFDAGERSYTYDDLDGNTAVTTRAADRAAALGVVVVTSAGNSGNCSAPSPTCWYYIGTPADGDSVIAVGAVALDSTRAAFTSYGPAADGRIKPDVSAPGVSIALASSATDYGTSNGTSFASPLVAAVACQILQVNPNLTPIQVRDLLRETADQAAAPGNALGWGIINAGAAVALAESLNPVAVEDDVPLPSEASVRTYPNPFSQRVTFEVTGVPHTATGALSLYDALGRRVAGPLDVPLHAGLNRIAYVNPGLSPGVYLFVLHGENVYHSGRLVLMD